MTAIDASTDLRNLDAEADPVPPRSTFFSWLVIAIVAVLGCAVLVGALVLRNQPRHHGISDREQRAVDAAGPLVVNISSYTRANFEKDWQLAMSGITGSTLIQQEQAEKAPILKAIQQGNFDVSGKVIDTAVESSSGNSVQLLVVLQGYRVAGSQSALTSISRLTVTVTQVGQKWLLSALTNVPLV